MVKMKQQRKRGKKVKTRRGIFKAISNRVVNSVTTGIYQRNKNLADLKKNNPEEYELHRASLYIFAIITVIIIVGYLFRNK